MEQLDTTIDLQLVQQEDLFTKTKLQKYYDEGYKCGPSSVGGDDPTTIRDALDVVLGLFRRDTTEITRKKVEGLEKEVEALKQTKRKYEKEIDDNAVILATETEARNNLEKRKEDLEKKSGVNSSLTHLVILGVSWVLMMVLVFAVYWYVGKATIIPMVEQALGLRTSMWFLTLLFPVCALGFGVVFHLFVKQIFNASNRVIVRVGAAAGALAVLAVAFWLDTVMGTEMSRQAYIKEFDAGRVTEEWNDAMAWKDNHFYIVLLLGFVSYLVWGILLSYLLSHPRFNKDGEGKSIDSQIRRIGVRLAELKTIIGITTRLVGKIDNDINSKNALIQDYLTGGFVIVVSDLKMVVGKFMNGYAMYINGYYHRDRDDVSEEAKEARKKSSETIKKAKTDTDDWMRTIEQNLGEKLKQC
jgi:hypothetical protein